MSRRAADLAQQATQPGRAALYETGAALWEAFFGNAGAARRGALAALELSKDRDVEYGAAFALASREILRGPRHWRTIWKGVFRRIRQSD